MTVIVASLDEKRMAANSMCIEADGSLSPVHKIFKVRDTLIGCAGDLVDATRAIDWIRTGCIGSHPKGNIELLILGKSKISTWTPLDGFVVVARRWGAVGTGASAAQGAMMAGADTRKAVRIACEIDSQSSGRVVSRTLKG